MLFALRREKARFQLTAYAAAFILIYDPVPLCVRQELPLAASRGFPLPKPQLLGRISF